MGGFFLGLDPNATVADAEQAARAEASLGGNCVVRVGVGLTAVLAGVGSDPAGLERDDDLLLIDGALSADCRSALQGSLGLPGATDAVLIKSAFAQWGAAAAPHLDGRFALALVDRPRGCVWLLRDALGECSLYFARQRGGWSISTSASTLIAAARLPKNEDSRAVAAFFALRAPPPGRCFWQGVDSVSAGACLCLRGTASRVARRSFRLSVAQGCFDTDADAVAAWREVLRSACARAITGARRPAVLLSGGIDSSALAALGASLRPDMLAVSWCLPGFPSADESALAAATAARLGIQLATLTAAEDWPLARIHEWTVDADAPLANSYRWLQQGVLRQAVELGADVVLSGNFGDHLYPDVDPQAAVSGSLATRLRHGVRSGLDRYPRLLAGLRWLARRRAATPRWLLPAWREQLRQSPWSGPAVLSPESIQEASLGRRFAAAARLDLRYVYRDPEVIRFMAALPAHWSVRDDCQKWITRELLSGAVPDSVRLRPKAGSLEPYFRFGLYDREADTVMGLLHDPRARWPEYVHAPILFEALANPQSESDLLLVWLAISYELWWRAQAGFGPAVLASAAHQAALFA